MGSWELLDESSEVAAVHAALLSSGEVVYYSGNTGPTIPAAARIWNPTTREVRSPPNIPDTDLFCSGLTLLFDGRVFVVGGTAKYSEGPGDPWFGSKAAYLFEPGGGWERLADMSFGRWYPSAVCLPDGRLLVASGEGDGGARTESLEIYDPFGGWEVLPASANRFLPLYPRLHVLPSGEVACAGQGGATAILNLQSRQWREVAPPLFIGGGSEDGLPASLTPASGRRRPPRRPRAAPPHHHEPGSAAPRPDDLSVLLAPVESARLLNAGGGSPAIANAHIMDFGEPVPAWREVAPMGNPRWFPNSALLPDGTLFVVGGGRFYNEDPVMEPEIFDPLTETWSVDAPMAVPRLYHSTALLLPDRRVWVAGTDNETRMELYTPDYLLGGPRPVLFAAPQSVAYGQGFTIPMADAGDVASVCFIRLSAVTHAFNMGQRYVTLAFAVTSAEEIEITAPSDPNVAPPGHYMLFVNNSAGVPAVAPIVQLVAS